MHSNRNIEDLDVIYFQRRFKKKIEQTEDKKTAEMVTPAL